MPTLLRFATAGSVDDGKSTLIGRLLHDAKGVLEDQWASVQQTSTDRGRDEADLSLLTDGLRSEREQGITIDVAYRYFATPRRKFIIADTPGHAQHTRNMVTGASTAKLAVVLVDARHGLVEQSWRHAYLSSLLGIEHLVLAVNKMDLVNWDRERFEAIRDEFTVFADRLGVRDVTAIPVSALTGDNVVDPSGSTPWYTGPTLLGHLEQVRVTDDRDGAELRLPVQYVTRPEGGERHYAGTVAGGVLRPGDEVVVLPAGVSTTIGAVECPEGPLDEAVPQMAVSITLDDDLDVARGDMLTHVATQLRPVREVDATVCWLGDGDPLVEGAEYVLKHTTRSTRARVMALEQRLDVTTLRPDDAAMSLSLNEIGRVRLRTRDPLVLDDYRSNATTGSFILIDPNTDNTVGAGMVLPAEAEPEVIYHPSRVRAQDRPTTGATLWFTGLSGSGKSTVAVAAEQELVAQGRPAVVLDGDNLRHGLNSDLGFGMADRAENLRRLAHVSALLARAGLVVLVSAISPLDQQRELARRIHRDAGLDLHEIHVDTPLDVCEQRDPKGLYARARAGEITQFTGLDSPYEPPADPDLRLVPQSTPQAQAQQVLALLADRELGR